MILGLNSIELTVLLGNNGVFQYLTGLPRVPGPNTLKRFLIDKAGVLKPRLGSAHNLLRAHFLANHSSYWLDFDSTVKTLYGNQEGVVKGYNPEHKGKKSYHPLICTEAHFQDCLGGELRYGNVDTKDEEIKTFLFLLENGEQTAGNLAKKAGLSRPSLYGFLKKLKENGLIIESQKNSVKTFQTSSKEKIQSILDGQINELEKGKSDIEKIFTEIRKGTLATSPKFQFFEGKDGVQHVLKDLLLHRNIETKTYWPIKSMIEILSEDFFINLNKERIKKNIY